MALFLALTHSLSLRERSWSPELRFSSPSLVSSLIGSAARSAMFFSGTAPSPLSFFFFFYLWRFFFFGPFGPRGSFFLGPAGFLSGFFLPQLALFSFCLFFPVSPLLTLRSGSYALLSSFFLSDWLQVIFNDCSERLP